MRLIRCPREMRDWSDRTRGAGRTIGFVPTMGCLHAGHLALVDRARERTDETVVSVYVNPAQFGPDEDFDRYPRSWEHDLEQCQQHAVAVVFAPEEMYAADHSVYVVEDLVSNQYCGAFRPGHFRGVLTVVAKLFHRVHPHLAVFGRKDAQQAFLVRRMVRDLDFDLEIDVAPIVREPDGVAMSSRNRYLNPAERRGAGALFKALRTAQRAYAAGERNAAKVCAHLRATLESMPDVRVEYVAAVGTETMRPVSRLAKGTLILLAAYVGRTRLIDNIGIEEREYE